jgi:LytR cell envelope-related transcriptional attenuator
MTDFVDDLERELLAAARRRGTRRLRVPVRAPAIAVVVALVAVVAVGFAVRAGSDPERPAPPAPAVAPPSRPSQPQADVLVLNETRVEGLAGAIRDELYVRFRLDIAVDTGDVHSRRDTVVRSGPGGAQLGRKVADALDAPLEVDSQLRPVNGLRAQVLVLVGTDRMR